MGLGKTVIVIATAEHLIESGEIGGGLIIAPASLKYQWAGQIDKFTGGAANVLVVDGDLKQRIRQYQQIKEGRVEYAILNYEQVVNDWSVVRHLPRDFICLDEAQAIKGLSSKRTRAIKKMKARYRWGLTGQPVENRAEDVFSIMEWVDPTVLGPATVFDRSFIIRDGFGRVQGYRNLPTLHKALARKMVRKTWDDPDVRDQMPKVTEESMLIDLDVSSSVLYRQITKELIEALEGTTFRGSFDVAAHYAGESSTGSAEMGTIMSRLTCLRMLCDSPELIKASADLKMGVAPLEGALMGSTAGGSVYAAELQSRGLLTKIKGGGVKIRVATDLIKDLLSEDPRNKIVLFSFFKGSLALMEQALRPYTECAMFHGDIPPIEREAQKQRFLKDAKCRVFLSSDAGGVGLDLPVANYCISLDLPWSAGAWAQRNARIIRLSSEWSNVTVISLLIAGSIEEWQYDILAGKQALADAVTDGRGVGAKGNLDSERESLLDFLRASSI